MRYYEKNQFEIKFKIAAEKQFVFISLFLRWIPCKNTILGANFFLGIHFEKIRKWRRFKIGCKKNIVHYSLVFPKSGRTLKFIHKYQICGRFFITWLHIDFCSHFEYIDGDLYELRKPVLPNFTGEG
jgi:hypothetical protein